MANSIPCRAALCEVLLKHAQDDKNIVVLCSDSRGSGSMGSFFEAFPEQSIEVGIAEQDLVGIAAGLAACGKKAFAVSPACFLSTRAYEQAKVDCAYAHNNVTLIGISGGVSYGALGATHHSVQDIAAMSALPGMRVYLPSDRFQAAWLAEQLLTDDQPAYVRIGRNAVPDLYDKNEHPPFNKAAWLARGTDVAIIACGELVHHAKDAVSLLAEAGISATLLDMYCIKPLDVDAVYEAAAAAKAVLTVEEHSPYGGLGSQVAQVVARQCPKLVQNLSLPDEPVVSGTSAEVFAHYELDASGIAQAAQALLSKANRRCSA